jgi:hypothetical protein
MEIDREVLVRAERGAQILDAARGGLERDAGRVVDVAAELVVHAPGGVFIGERAAGIGHEALLQVGEVLGGDEVAHELLELAEGQGVLVDHAAGVEAVLGAKRNARVEPGALHLEPQAVLGHEVAVAGLLHGGELAEARHHEGRGVRVEDRVARIQGFSHVLCPSRGAWPGPRRRALLRPGTRSGRRCRRARAAGPPKNRRARLGSARAGRGRGRSGA